MGHDEFYVARLYRALTDESRRMWVDPPAVVRARADRHARTRTTLAVTTVFVLVVGLSTVAGLLFGVREPATGPGPQVTTPPTPAITKPLAEWRDDAG